MLNVPLFRSRGRKYGATFGNSGVAFGSVRLNDLERYVGIECPCTFGRLHDDFGACVIGLGRRTIEVVVKHNLVIGPLVVDVVEWSNGSANGDLWL